MIRFDLTVNNGRVLVSMLSDTFTMSAYTQSLADPDEYQVSLARTMVIWMSVVEIRFFSVCKWCNLSFSCTHIAQSHRDDCENVIRWKLFVSHLQAFQSYATHKHTHFITKCPTIIDRLAVELTLNTFCTIMH